VVWSKVAVSDTLVDIWMLLPIASVMMSIVIGLAQYCRGRKFWDTRAFTLLAIVFSAWAIPLFSTILVTVWDYYFKGILEGQR
jgi:hypothetical protein